MEGGGRRDLGIRLAGVAPVAAPEAASWKRGGEGGRVEVWGIRGIVFFRIEGKAARRPPLGPRARRRVRGWGPRRRRARAGARAVLPRPASTPRSGPGTLALRQEPWNSGGRGWAGCGAPATGKKKTTPHARAPRRPRPCPPPLPISLGPADTRPPPPRTAFRTRLAAWRGATGPAAQPTWWRPASSPVPHLGQWRSSHPCPRSRPLPRTSGGDRWCTFRRHSSAKDRLQPGQGQMKRASSPPGSTPARAAATAAAAAAADMDGKKRRPQRGEGDAAKEGRRGKTSHTRARAGLKTKRV